MEVSDSENRNEGMYIIRVMKTIIKRLHMVIFQTDGGKIYVRCTKDKINDVNLRSLNR